MAERANTARKSSSRAPRSGADRTRADQDRVDHGKAGQGRADQEKFAEIRAALELRADELRIEYRQAVADLQTYQRDRVSDGAGDDQADTGTKTFEREQELALANGIRERLEQVEHALARLDEGTYGSCERCGNPIPTARLEAFPSVTLCVACKQIEERR